MAGRPRRMTCAMPECGEPTLYRQGIPTGNMQKDKFCSYDCFRDYDRRVKFNLQPGQARTLYEQQNGRCAVCGTAKLFTATRRGGNDSLHIDHNHTTGEIRGMLCMSCNRGIGFLADDPQRLRAAADYIERNSNE